MKIARILMKLIYFIYATLYFRSIRLAYILVLYTVDFHFLSNLKRQNNQLVFKHTDNKIYINQLHWFGFLFPMLNYYVDLNSKEVI
jgi:hypothetical protein